MEVLKISVPYQKVVKLQCCTQALSSSLESSNSRTETKHIKGFCFHTPAVTRLLHIWFFSLHCHTVNNLILKLLH